VRGEESSRRCWLGSTTGQRFTAAHLLRNCRPSHTLALRERVFQWQTCWVCERCVELDAKIEHYQKLARMISDQRILDVIAKTIEEANAEKAVLHPEGEPS
jgi:hypothetical protein